MKPIVTSSLVFAIAIGAGRALPAQGTGPVRWDPGDGGNGHVYEAVLAPDGITWAEANDAAIARGASWHLATITSAEENVFVFGLISGDGRFWQWCCGGQQIRGEGPWIGAYNAGECGWFAWVTGEEFSYSNWAPFEPFCNGDKVQFYGFTDLIGPYWNDVPGDKVLPGYIVEADGETGFFRRGDANADGDADLTDVIFILSFLFLGTQNTTCTRSADANDDGSVDISDPAYLLLHIFLGAPPPPEPRGCGLDPRPDRLTCESFAGCL